MAFTVNEIARPSGRPVIVHESDPEDVHDFDPADAVATYRVMP
jgi:hypothetical protein